MNALQAMKSAAIATTLLISAVPLAHSVPITVEAQYRGTYDHNGVLFDHDSTPDAGYFAGVTFLPLVGGVQTEFRNFFSFDVGAAHGSQTTRRITKATIILDNWNPIGVATTASNVISYGLFDVTTSNPEAGISAPDIFDDLGSGVGYGSDLISFFERQQPWSFDLNDEALTQLNSHNRHFIVGGRAGLPPNISATAGVFGGSFQPYEGHPFLSRLVLDVEPAQIPEPSSMLLFLGAGLAGLLATGKGHARTLT